MGKFLSLFIIVLVSFQLFSQKNNLTNERAAQFIEALISDGDSFELFVFPEELALSNRLGINYEGVKHKFLISYEIPDEIKGKIKNHDIDYKIDIEELDSNYSVLNFGTLNFTTRYYFFNEYLISPPYFYFKDWPKYESKHFIFYVSEQEYFNQYSINMLEQFIIKIFSIMGFTQEEKESLAKEKIIYVLCRDENEIEKLTGYKARGMCNLAYDYLITTYNCHYHELIHLLINFKLNNLPLYTHPFLQEGLAVALGGRGGKEPDVILNLGHFLEKSGFINYKELLSSSEFKNYDPSMSYPLSGLYNKFLLSNYEFDKYIDLYRNFSSSSFQQMNISSDVLADESEWKKFLNDYTINSININFDQNNFTSTIKHHDYFISESEEYYLVGTEGSFLISTPNEYENYESKIFQEFCPNQGYKSEKYLIRLSEEEISIYNLFTNNLIANYVSGFSMDSKPVPKVNGLF